MPIAGSLLAQVCWTELEWLCPSTWQLLVAACLRPPLNCLLQGAWRTILERLKDFRQNSAGEDLLPRAAWYALALSKLRMYSAAAEELDLLGPLDAPHYSEQTPHGARTYATLCLPVSPVTTVRCALLARPR